MACEKRFILVPDGAHLFLQLFSADSGSFTGAAEARSQGAVVRTWTHAELVGHSPPLDLRSVDRSYGISIDLAFVAGAVVTTVCLILRPDGSVHSVPWACATTGANGQVRSVSIDVHMI